MRDRTKEIAIAYKTFNDAFSNNDDNVDVCSNTILPDYEKNVFKEYVED